MTNTELKQLQHKAANIADECAGSSDNNAPTIGMLATILAVLVEIAIRQPTSCEKW